MQRVAAIALVLLYFAGVVVGPALIGPVMAPWFLAAWSVAFVLCYLVAARGSRMVAVATVIVVTLLLPIAALVAIAWPVYHSLPAVLASFYGAFKESGLFRAVELLVPLVAALLALPLARVLRRGSSHGPSSPHAP